VHQVGHLPDINRFVLYNRGGVCLPYGTHQVLTINRYISSLEG